MLDRATTSGDVVVKVGPLRHETNLPRPGTLWAVVLIGAALSICASYLLSIQSLLVQAFLTILLSSMIALLVFFIATTDHPYRGANAIGPGAYEIVFRNLEDYH
jgi:hypothetical protein